MSLGAQIWYFAIVSRDSSVTQLDEAVPVEFPVPFQSVQNASHLEAFIIPTSSV